MKQAFSFVGGLTIGALVFGIGGAFLGYVLGHGEPSVIVRNLTDSPIPQVRIETDIGETYTLDSISPAGSGRTDISGRDKSLWIVATLSDGTTKTSEQIYVTSQGTVFVAVSGDAISIDYAL
jgi:hypothetical protein